MWSQNNYKYRRKLKKTVVFIYEVNLREQEICPSHEYISFLVSALIYWLYYGDLRLTQFLKSVFPPLSVHKRRRKNFKFYWVHKYIKYNISPWIGKIPWSRKWQPTPVFLPGKFHGQKSLVGYSPCGCK